MAVEDERMSARQYAKYDKVFYVFGSLTKMVNPVRPDEWPEIAEMMWTWAIMKVESLVERLSTPLPPYEPPPEEEMLPEPPEPTPPEPEQQPSAYISQKQIKRLFAIAHNAGKNNEQIRAYLATYGYKSSSVILKTDYERLCALVQQ